MPKVQNSLELAVIDGLARGFAKAGDAGLDPALHAEGLWIIWNRLSRSPLPSFEKMSAEQISKFSSMQTAVTEKVVRLKLIDPEG